MRLSRADFRSACKSFLRIEFASQDITAFGGLELIRRYLGLINFTGRVQSVFSRYGLGGDYRAIDMILVIVGLILAGGRRLDHLNYLCDDPVVKRFCGLLRLPRERSVARWLKRFSHKSLRGLVEINSQIVCEAVTKEKLGRLTLDIDGSVITTGASVSWAFRGFNPHHRKDPSYYPILAHLAQTGHILRVKNRPGNVHDSKGAVAFVRDLIDDVRMRLGRSLPLEFRMDGAFFQREIIELLDRRGAGYAIKVPFYPWLGLKPLIQRQRRWTRITPNLEAFEAMVTIRTWKRSLLIAIYRRRVQHESPKNFQLDLFDPDDGHWEYSAITTNKSLGLKALWKFMAGRGTHEKVLAQLKNGYAFDTIPTRNFAANSTWQILSVLAHNLITNFQIALAAAPRARTSKRRSLFLLRSIHTLRYEFLGRAGTVGRPQGRATLTLAPNLPTQKLFERIVAKLASAA